MKNVPSITKNGDQPRKLAELRQAYQEWNQEPDALTRLSRRLTTTLSLETQIGILAEELAETVPYDHLIYRHAIGSQDFVYASGMGGPHRCDYRLNLGGVNYGSLTLSRRKRFTEGELEGIELLLSAAICPIRNACRYATVEQAALTDSLTGVPNKRALDDAIDRACKVSDRHNEEYTLILCDLDHFKEVNDTYGHVIGDHILRETAREIETAIRSSDSLYRFGGEEFAVVLPHTGEAEAQVVAERIREHIAGISVNCGENNVTVTASSGVATRLREESPEQWVARADDALYRAKDHGRNCTRLSSTIR